MASFSCLCRNALLIAGMVVPLSIPAFADGIAATAVLSSQPDATSAGLYDYSLMLNNTGTTTVGTFWFSWVPGAGFLSSAPTNVASPASWNALVTNAGRAIQWTTTASLLQPGQSLSGFNFSSFETPDQLLANNTVPGVGAGLPVATSFVYAGAPLVGPGAQFVVSQVTPEPSSFVLLASGLLGGAGAMFRRFRGAGAA